MVGIPNILSVFRLLLVPVFALLYFGSAEHAKLYAAAVYALAAVTDFMDGWIARKYHMESKLGRVLDPLGDKVMTFVVLICLAADNLIPMWAVYVFFVKEALMAVGGLLIYRSSTDMPPSNVFGKCATVVFIVVCGLLMVFKNIPREAATAMIAFAIAVMLAAFISYAIRYIKIMKARKGSGE